MSCMLVRYHHCVQHRGLTANYVVFGAKPFPHYLFVRACAFRRRLYRQSIAQSLTSHAWLEARAWACLATLEFESRMRVVVAFCIHEGAALRQTDLEPPPTPATESQWQHR